ncbi:MAG: hypothetical protein B6A08_12150 [Sorangiineae bacterium NIC37A_2]|nr:MAG: hypothetical protein B6A08_12150 [Sorangiineae bacterium NIC37A_2]
MAGAPPLPLSEGSGITSPDGIQYSPSKRCPGGQGEGPSLVPVEAAGAEPPQAVPRKSAPRNAILARANSRDLFPLGAAFIMTRMIEEMRREGKT